MGRPGSGKDRKLKAQPMNARQAAPQPTWQQRIYKRDWYLKHRRTEWLTPTELERCVRRPALIREIRGPEWIACGLCGLIGKNLGAHICREHSAELAPIAEKIARETRSFKPTQLTCLAFRKKLGLAKRFPLMCRILSD